MRLPSDATIIRPAWDVAPRPGADSAVYGLASGIHKDNGAVIVAMAVVGVVQVSVHQVVYVVAMGDGFVTAPRPVDMVRIVPAAAVIRRACIWIGLRDGDRVLVHMAVVGMVQVSVMEVVDVPVMQDGLVAAVGTVDMVVCFMNLAIRHFLAPFVI